MEFPACLWFGPLAVHPYWLFECLAYVVGVRVYARVKARFGDPLGSSARW